MSALILVVPVMFMSGIVGGLINFFIADPTDEAPLAWWKHLVIGVGASFTVPVFLNMISSNLISEIMGELSDAKVVAKLLVLAGFCLLAAISSRAFLRSLSERVLKEVKSARKEAKEAREEAADAKAAVSPLIEEEIAPVNLASGSTFAESPAPEVTDQERRILKAMTMSHYSMRSLTGLAKDTGVAKAVVNATITTLMQKGLISEAKNKEGQLRWYPTLLGRSLADENNSVRATQLTK